MHAREPCNGDREDWEKWTRDKRWKNKSGWSNPVKGYHETPISGHKTFIQRKNKGEDNELIEISLDLDMDTDLHDEYFKRIDNIIPDKPNQQEFV